MRSIGGTTTLLALVVTSLVWAAPPSESKIEKQERKYAKQQEKLYARDRKASEVMAKRSARYRERKGKQQGNVSGAHNQPQ